MNKLVIALSCIILAALATTGVLPPAQGAVFGHVTPTVTAAHAPLEILTPTKRAIRSTQYAVRNTQPSPTPQKTPAATPEPDIPAVMDEIYLGVPAGNGHNPYHAAVDAAHRRLITLNYGLSGSREGNTLSILDLETGQVTRLVSLGNTRTGDLTPSDPLDVQVDPYRPRLYALWGNRYAEATDSTLTILDAETLEVLDNVPGVEAIAPAPDRLYLANDTRVWSADPDSLAEIEARTLENRTFNEPLLVNPQTNRLYLGRGYPGSLEVFEAGSLSPLGSYPIADRLARAAIHPGSGRLLIVESDGVRVLLRELDADGRPLVAPAPIPLSEEVYADYPLAVHEDSLYIAGGKYGDYRLEAFDLPNLARRESLPLPIQPYDLVADPESGQLYGVYNTWSSYVQAIDPVTGPREIVYTALTISDALADPTSGRLYALDEGGMLRVLSLATLRPTASVETGFNLLSGVYSGYGELSLDPSRDRLYIGGDPVRMVDTRALTVTARLDGRGQVTADPTSDRVYLTPPCACRVEQCNTLILDAETLTGTQTLYPPSDPMVAPCLEATSLDAENQLLYARIYNGTPGSNSGSYYTIFDVAGRPEELFTAWEISYGKPALDPLRARAFAPRYRINRAYIHRFEAQGEMRAGASITQTLTLAGATGYLAYDAPRDRLYAVQEEALQVFDGDLALLAEIELPGEFDPLSYDPQGRRLYLGDSDGNILVVAASGGELQAPTPAAPGSQAPLVQQALYAPDGALFRVADGRLYRSDDDGESWELLGRGLPRRRVSDAALSSDYAADRTLLVGLTGSDYAGGLYRSEDGGQTWRPTTRGLTDLAIRKIVFSPTYAEDHTIFVTAAEQGLFRSTDGGQMWTPLADTYASNPYNRQVEYLAVSPAFADDRMVLVGRSNLLRSTDGGESWSDTGVPAGLAAFSPDFARDGLILNEGTWRSADRGRTWQPAAVGREPGAAQALFFSADFAADQTVYLLLKDEYDQPLRAQRSTDGGGSWQSLVGGLPAGFEIGVAAALPGSELQLTQPDGEQLVAQAEALSWEAPQVDAASRQYMQALAVAPGGTLFLGDSAAGVFESTDGGRTWAETGFTARADDVAHPAQLAVADDGTLFAATGPALARRAPGGGRWTHLARVPAGFEIASLALSPSFSQDGIVLLGGNYQNNGILRSADGGRSWRMVFDADTLDLEYASDVSALAFSPDFFHDRTVYAWLQDGGLLRSTDGGLSWALIMKSDQLSQALAVAPAGDRLYLGALYGHALVSDDGGRTWRDLRDALPEDLVWASALAFGEEGDLFLGTDRGVYRSRDAGETWSLASAGLPLQTDGVTPGAARALAVYDGRLYALIAYQGLFVSEDGGETWRSTLSGQPASPLGPTATGTPQPPDATPVICTATPEHFAEPWAARAAQLACPIAAYLAPMAEQSFEGGRMFWRGDTRQIYVLPDGQPYARFDDTWDQDQPIYACPDLAPSQTPPTPQRGFGKVWCSDPLVRERLGNATGEERPAQGTLQEFEQGLMFSTEEGAIYVLESGSGGWERVE